MSLSRHHLPPVLYVLGDESGGFKVNDWMVVGLILLSDPVARRAELAELRRQKSFYHELKYGSTDKYRIPFALAVIDWFFDATDVEFRCIARSGAEHDSSYYSRGFRGVNADTLAYNVTYKQVIKFNLPADPRRVLVKIDEKSRHRYDNLLTYLPSQIPSIRRVDEADSKSDDLLQVIDLLTGCVHGDLVGTPDPLKRALSDQFLRRAGTPSALKPPTACTRSKVNVWYWNPVYAKKRAAGRS